MSTNTRKNFKVQIKDIRFIPFLNRIGPIMEPTNIGEEIYDSLVKLGFNIIVTDTLVSDVSGNVVATESKDFIESGSDELASSAQRVDYGNGHLPSALPDPLEGANLTMEQFEEQEEEVEEEPQVEKKQETVSSTSVTIEGMEIFFDIDVYNSMTKTQLLEIVKEAMSKDLILVEGAINTTTTKGKLLEIVAELVAKVTPSGKL